MLTVGYGLITFIEKITLSLSKANLIFSSHLYYPNERYDPVCGL